MRNYYQSARGAAIPIVLVALSLGVTQAGCSHTVRNQVETAATDVLLPPAEEAKLGEQIEAELSRQLKYVENPEATRYVEALAARLFQAAKSQTPGLTLKVHVIDDAKTVNAFATPGAQLYVYSGLIMAAQSEAELAGVIGHEIGHIVARHPARHMVNEFGLSAVTAIILGENAPLLQQLAASAAAQGYLLANSRSDETEADELGARFANSAGYDPRALGRFLQRIAGQEETPGFLVFLSDHPLTPDRVAHLEDYIARNGLSGQEGDRARLAAVKRILQSSGVGGGPR